MDIGFIGLGIMGTPMALHLAAAGHPLSVQTTGPVPEAFSATSAKVRANLSNEPENFGTGHPAGVVASESSNNGPTGGALIPLVSLGIPGGSTTAVPIGAYTLQGIQVGPLLIGETPGTWNVMMVGLAGAQAPRVGIEIASFMIGFILGSSAELYFVKSLEAFGTLTIFFTKSPIAWFPWGLIGLTIFFSIYSARKAKRALARAAA